VLSLGAGGLILQQSIIGLTESQTDYGPTIEAWIDAPGGLAVSPEGDIYIADSNYSVVHRINARNTNVEVVAGGRDLGAGFTGDGVAATTTQLDTPDGLALAPDGDLLIADSHNDRIRRVDKETGIISTVAGSGEDGYDGDDKVAIEASLATPSAVAVASNGDLYIADTLNNRIRKVDAASGTIHTVAGDGETGANSLEVGDGGPATKAHLNTPSDVAVAPNGDIYIADMHHHRVRKVDARTGLISTVAGTGVWGHTGDERLATSARLAGPAGIALVPEPGGKLTLYIADYYNGQIHSVKPDGIIRELSRGKQKQNFGAPTRVAYSVQRGWLYVADASRDRILPFVLQMAPPSPASSRPPSAMLSPVAR
jgi:sugar lactone lactonase YvrE